MIFGMTLYQILWYFLIYSFLGWVVEVAFHCVTLGKVINRGFLNGPVCPVYGFGVLSVFAAVNTIQIGGEPLNAFGIFLFGVVLATAVELLAGWLLDVCFHARWWDYSNNPMNFHGYICAEFSLIWGFAILLVVRVFQSYLEHLMSFFPVNMAGWILLAVLYAGYLADFGITVAIIQGFNKKLTQLDRMRADMRMVSDRISEQVGDTTFGAMQRVGEAQLQAALGKAELRDAIEEKKDELRDAIGEKRDELADAMNETRTAMNETKAAMEETRAAMEEKYDELKDLVGELKDETIEELRARKEALQKEFEELSASMVKNSFFGLGHLLKAFPGMQHRNYQDIVQMLKDKMNDQMK